MRPDERDEAPLLVERRAGVLNLQLNRPQARNAINWELRRSLSTTLRQAASDVDVRVIVLRGDQRAFCAGGDTKEMGGGRADDLAKLAMAKQVVTTIADMPQPVVAVVRGHAAGAGFSLALACDLVLADGSALFSAPFLERGLVPDMGASSWLVRHAGLMRAKEILLTGRRVDSTEAYELGIVSRLCTAEELDEVAERVATELASRSPTALGLTKRLLNQAPTRDLASALDDEQTSQALAAGTDEARGRLRHAQGAGGPTDPTQEEDR